jgi:DNA-binding transcriptional MerR regulator
VFSIKEVSEKIGIPYYRIAYAHQTGKLPEPLRWKGQRVYVDEDIEQAKEYFRSRRGKRKPTRESEGGEH